MLLVGNRGGGSGQLPFLRQQVSCLVHAFHYRAGVPQSTLTDNMKTVQRSACTYS